MAGPSRSYRAQGNIPPRRFVKIVADNTVRVCVADEQADGVSHEGTEDAPIPGATQFAATDGNACRVYGLGEPCEVDAGAAVAAGASVKPDANGKAVTATTGNRASGVAAYSATAADEHLKITVQRFETA